MHGQLLPQTFKQKLFANHTGILVVHNRKLADLIIDTDKMAIL